MILLEEIRGQYRAVLEAVGDMQKQLVDVPKRDEFEALRSDVITIKIAVTDLSSHVNNHETRIQTLERTSATQI